jgi:hypothetical protein
LNKAESKSLSSLIVIDWFALVLSGGTAFCVQHGTKIVVMHAEKLSPEKEMGEDWILNHSCF